MEITTEENRISIDGVSYPKGGFYVKPIPKGVALVDMSKSWSIKILVDGTTIDGSPVADRDELMTFFNEQGFKSGGSGPGTEVSWGSITGDIEDQADLVNYIQSIPPLPKNGLYVNEENEIQIGNLPLDNSGNGDIIQDTFLKAVSESPEGLHKYGIIYLLDSTQSETVGLMSSFLIEGVAIISNIGVEAASFHNLISSPVGDIEIAANLFAHPIKIRDSRFNTGIIYDDDYSEQGASNDRWIPDWGAVKDYVDSAVEVDPVTWATIEGKPDFVAEGADAAAARTALGLGTAATTDSSAYATAAQGALASSAVQPTTLDSRLSEAQRIAINALVSPTEDYADMAEATAAIKSIIDALKAT